MWSRRALLKSAAVLAAPIGMSTPSHAAPMDGVVKLVVGFPPGSSIDIVARRYANKLQGRYAQTVIVENRVGAAGRIALDSVKRTAPDGRTMFIVPSPLFTLYPHTYKSLNYDPVRDFEAAGTLYDSSLGVAIGPAVPAHVTTLAQFVEWAKAQSSPVFFSANAQGAGPHFMGLQLAQRAGFKVDYVPYQGGAQAIQALLAGDLPMVSISMGTLAPLARSGKVRILGVFDDTRNTFYPEAPTLKESGYPDLVENEWGGMFLPAGTPRETVVALESALAEAAAQPDLIEGMNGQFLTVRFRDAKATAAAVKAGLERHRKVVQASGFTPS